MKISPTDVVDLQIHTVYSDGHWQLEQLFAHLAGARFRVVSITDHDDMNHLDELRALGAARGVHVLPGVEMTTSWRGHSAHLLCYASAFHGDRLIRLARSTVARQLANTREVHAELMRRGYVFPADAAPPLRPIDNAHLLLANGYVATLDDGLRLIAEVGYRSITVPLSDAVAAAHESSALAVLAHPGRGGGEIYRYDVPLLGEMVDELPLDGIEVRYPTYTDEQVAAYSAFARDHGLLASAGSDSHGPDQRLPIPYSAATCAELLGRCGIIVE